MRGCYTRERIAAGAPRRTVTTRTVTTDYYTTPRPYTSTVTREYDAEPVTRTFYSEPVTRTFDEEIYSGSSMPFGWGGYYGGRAAGFLTAIWGVLRLFARTTSPGVMPVARPSA